MWMAGERLKRVCSSTISRQNLLTLAQNQFSSDSSSQSLNSNLIGRFVYAKYDLHLSNRHQVALVHHVALLHCCDRPRCCDCTAAVNHTAAIHGSESPTVVAHHGISVATHYLVIALRILLWDSQWKLPDQPCWINNNRWAYWLRWDLILSLRHLLCIGHSPTDRWLSAIAVNGIGWMPSNGSYLLESNDWTLSNELVVGHKDWNLQIS